MSLSLATAPNWSSKSLCDPFLGHVGTGSGFATAKRTKSNATVSVVRRVENKAMMVRCRGVLDSDSGTGDRSGKSSS